MVCFLRDGGNVNTIPICAYLELKPGSITTKQTLQQTLHSHVQKLSNGLLGSLYLHINSCIVGWLVRCTIYHHQLLCGARGFLSSSAYHYTAIFSQHASPHRGHNSCSYDRCSHIYFFNYPI